MIRRPCLVTASSEGFLPGTIALLHSVRRFHGADALPAVVVHHGLADRSRREIESIAGVQTRPISAPLQAALATLVNRHPELDRFAPRFYSLDAFAQDGVGPVIYLDSDILCRGDLTRLTAVEKGIHAAPDRSGLAGNLRDPNTFLPVTNPGDYPVLPGRRTPLKAFNSGVMALGRDNLGPGVHARLLASLTELDWGRVATGHTDQYLLNRAFADRWSPLPPTFNTILPRLDEERSEHDPEPRGATLLHFVGGPKPWGGRAGPDWPGFREPHRTAFGLWESEWEAWARHRLRHHRDPRPHFWLMGRRTLRTVRRVVRGRRPQ